MILEKPRNVVAATITTLGPGAALSFYLAGVGFFVVRFNSRNILLWMLLAVYSPFPVALLLQEKFDAGFDKVFTTRVTFFFRVIVVPLMMAVLIGVLALLCTMWIAVLLCGLFMGFFFRSNPRFFFTNGLRLGPSVSCVGTDWKHSGCNRILLSVFHLLLCCFQGHEDRVPSDSTCSNRHHQHHQRHIDVLALQIRPV